MSRSIRASRRGVLLPAVGVTALVAVGVGVSGAVLLPTDDAPPPRAARGTVTTVAAVGSPAGPTWTAWRAGGRASAEPTDRGWRLALDTRGAPADEVRAVGVAAGPLRLGEGLLLRGELEWFASGNASYWTAGLLLSSRAPEGGLASLDVEPAVRLELVGVPPGRTARRYGALRVGARTIPLATDGWPERPGRALERATLELELTASWVTLRADGEQLARVPRPIGLAAGDVWALAYATSHANYAERAVRFQDLVLSPLAATWLPARCP